MSQEIMIVALSAIGPVIGSGIGVWKRPTTNYIHNMLYFATGIMLAISFLDLIPESRHLGSILTCVAGLAIGATAMWALDRVFPHVHGYAACGEDECHMGHTANFLILAIFLHNFPEGMAIAIGAATDVSDSIVIAAAIAIHNIPEGICTSAPHYYAYGNRWKSFMMSSLSALPIVVGYSGATHIPDRPENGTKDFSKVVERAKNCAPPVEIETGKIVGGFARNQVLALADKVVDAVKSGAIKRFIVMAGCDGRQKSRNYFTQVAEQLPKDTVILTAGCAKYRYNKLDLGDIGGIPRVLDAGQCNDCYSLAVIALKLKEVFELDDINDLPISFDIGWYEQKAVAVLLALLFLGVKGIRLGPTLPAFVPRQYLMCWWRSSILNRSARSERISKP